MEEPKTNSLVISQTGSIALDNLKDQFAFAKQLIDQKMISESFKTVQQVVIGFQYAKALKINEMLAIKMMYVVNGRPSLYGEGPLALVQRDKSFKKIREYYINDSGDEICPANKNIKDAKFFGSVSELWRVGDDTAQIDFFTLDDLSKAKLDFNNFGKKKDVWEKWERIMMRYKARSMGLRSKFADVIGGIPISEYDFNFTPEIPEIRDAKANIANELNDAFIEKAEIEGQTINEIN